MGGQNEESNLQNTYQGFMDFSGITLPINDGDFYLCGPIGFMQFAKEQLLTLNVPETNIHYEVFGPHQYL